MPPLRDVTDNRTGVSPAFVFQIVQGHFDRDQRTILPSMEGFILDGLTLLQQSQPLQIALVVMVWNNIRDSEIPDFV
jgi:hypothetical protein